MRGAALQAYAAAGIGSDHESTTIEEGRERLRAGMWLLIREATGARNLHALIPLARELGPHRIALCTDDRDPQHIAADGHVNALVRDAVAEGVDPADAIVMATLNAATWHGLAGLGAVAPAHRADVLVLPDLERFVPDIVLTAGRPPGEIAPAPVPEWVRHTVRIAPLTLGDLRIPWDERRRRSGHRHRPRPDRDRVPVEVADRRRGSCCRRPRARPGQDRRRRAAPRHRPDRPGARARARPAARRPRDSTIAHDAHNIVCVGVDDGDMARAVQRLAELGGGMVVVRDRGIRAELPLPVAGLLSDAPLEQVLEQTAAVSAAALELGTSLESPFHAIGFLSLSVIPELKITDRGLIDVGRFEIVPLRVDALGRLGPASATGSPAAFHASKPPIMSVASLTPMSRSVAAARLDAYPSWHMTMTGPVRATTSGSSQPDVGSTRHSTMFRDMTIAPGMTPCSAAARTCACRG